MENLVSFGETFQSSHCNLPSLDSNPLHFQKFQSLSTYWPPITNLSPFVLGWFQFLHSECYTIECFLVVDQSTKNFWVVDLRPLKEFPFLSQSQKGRLSQYQPSFKTFEPLFSLVFCHLILLLARRLATNNQVFRLNNNVDQEMNKRCNQNFFFVSYRWNP